MTGNMDDSVITCIINFEKYSLKRLYHECITRAYREMLCDNPIKTNRNSSDTDIAQISYEHVQNLSKSIFAAYGVQVADLPLTGT